MGQYQQWLHFQEIDRRLRATLDALQQELDQIESQFDGSQQRVMLIANPIISALSAHMVASFNTLSLPQDNVDTCNNGSAQQAAEQSSIEGIETISAALLHWGELPDFGLQELRPSNQHDILPFLSLDRAEIELLPEDMFAFFEEHSQTDPQLNLPWWLRKITITSADADSGRPIDQESIRTNRLVQRWVERWGRQSQGAFTPESESDGIRNEE
jgi:hypothetical protein